MSEYQFIEFQALERPLTPQEQAKLRSYSTRARITATSFTNEYHWGNFKGNRDALIERYFDAMLYFANWGTRQLKFRIPARLLSSDAVIPFCDGGSVVVRESGQRTILTFTGEEIDDEELLDCSGLLSSMALLRAELARGDLRSLYLGWLSSVGSGFLEEEELEPPVPNGLGDLTGAQREFVNFFDVGVDLVAAAAEASPPLMESGPRREMIDLWLAKIPPAEKDDLLARLVAGEDANLANELFLSAIGTKHNTGTTTKRTVGQLLQRAEKLGEVRIRAEAESRAREIALREQKKAIAREKYLDGLAGQEDVLWLRVESLVVSKAAARYDEAVKLLVDLRDLAARHGQVEFGLRLVKFLEDRKSRPALIERIIKAGI